jgi:hypothetical protein
VEAEAAMTVAMVVVGEEEEDAYGRGAGRGAGGREGYARNSGRGDCFASIACVCTVGDEIFPSHVRKANARMPLLFCTTLLNSI